MNEFLYVLIQTILIVAVPIISAFVAQFLRRKSEQIGMQIDSLTTKELLSEVTEAVATAVTYTSQTYVDTLKTNGLFDKQAQMEALQISKDKALSLLSDSAKKTLMQSCDSLDDYLETMIEAQVRMQKQEGSSFLLSSPLGSIENVRESPDVASVAAAVQSTST